MDLTEWQQLGDFIDVGPDRLFVVDSPPTGVETAPPVLIIHGFPTSSVDWSSALPSLCASRRVVLFDLPGFGLSAKPDRRYSIGSAADATEGLINRLGLRDFDLVTHDMGDTVGGELLARDLEGTFADGDGDLRVRRRIVTNGSIYLEMARLTDGQQALWSAPDEILDPQATPNAELLTFALTATLAPSGSPSSNPDPAAVRLAAEAVCHDDGARLLPRLIRYLDDRRDNEARYTGAIESHPAPLGIVWGAEDPIALVDMARKLAGRREDAHLIELPGVGHYPMIESPAAFASAVLSQLDR